MDGWFSTSIELRDGAFSTSMTVRRVGLCAWRGGGLGFDLFGSDGRASGDGGEGRLLPGFVGEIGLCVPRSECRDISASTPSS